MLVINLCNHALRKQKEGEEEEGVGKRASPEETFSQEKLLKFD